MVESWVVRVHSAWNKCNEIQVTGNFTDAWTEYNAQVLARPELRIVLMRQCPESKRELVSVHHGATL